MYKHLYIMLLSIFGKISMSSLSLRNISIFFYQNPSPSPSPLVATNARNTKPK